MFTSNHFIWLLLCAFFIAVGTVAAVKKKLSVKAASYIMLAVCLISETSKMISNMIPSDAGGYVLDPKALPFHLCSLMIFAVVYITFSNNENLKAKVIDFLVPCALIAGICAMLIPTNGVDFLDIEAYQCFVYHAGLVWYALYFIFTKQVDLGFKSYRRNIVVLLVLSLASIYVNSILSAYGTNFMYTRKPPMSGLPLLNLDNGWYVYFIVLAALGAVLITAIHMPFMAGKGKARKCTK